MRSLVPKEVFSEPSAVTYPNSELSNCPWATGSEVRGGHRTVGKVSWSFDDAKFSKLMLGSLNSSVAVTLSLTNMHPPVLPGGLEPSCPLSVHRVIVRQAGAHPRLSCCLLAGASTLSASSPSAMDSFSCAHPARYFYCDGTRSIAHTGECQPTRSDQ